MPKLTGLAGTLMVDNSSSVAKDIGDDVTAYDFSTPRDTEDVTGMNKYANERLLLLTDFTVKFSGVFDNDANMSHDVFSTFTQSATARLVQISPTPTTTTPKITANCLITDYKVTRSSKAELTWEVPAQLADGIVPTWS
jgi:hypothetical protein